MVKSLIQKMREGLVITKDNKIRVDKMENTKITSITANTYGVLYTTDFNESVIVSNITIINEIPNLVLRSFTINIMIDGVDHEISPVFISKYGPSMIESSGTPKVYYMYEFTTPIRVKNSIVIKVKGSVELPINKITGNITIISGDYDE